MKLVCINIELNRHREKVLSFLKKENPNVICLQELLEEDFPLFKNKLGKEGVFELKGYIKDTYREEVMGKKYGVAIFANNISESGSIFYSGRRENILKSFEEFSENVENQRNVPLLWIETKDAKGEDFKFMTTHLPVTNSGEVTDFQLKVVDSLLKELKKIPEFVICGDTNAPRGLESFGRIARKYKDNIPLKYKTSIDQNLHRVKGIQYMVDCLFTTPSYKTKNVKLVDGISDHMAIVADIEKVSANSILMNAKKLLVHLPQSFYGRLRSRIRV